MEEFHHPGVRGRLPPATRKRFLQILFRLQNLNQQLRFAFALNPFRIDEGIVRTQRLSVFGDSGFQSRWEALTLLEKILGVSQGFDQDVLDPCPVHGRVETHGLRSGFVVPLLIGDLEILQMFRVMRVQALGKHAIQHRDREERPRDLNQR